MMIYKLQSTVEERQRAEVTWKVENTNRNYQEDDRVILRYAAGKPCKYDTGWRVKPVLGVNLHIKWLACGLK